MSQIHLQNSTISDDDWDQRPDYICKDCGFHKDSCSCKKTTRVRKKQNKKR